MLWFLSKANPSTCVLNPVSSQLLIEPAPFIVHSLLISQPLSFSFLWLLPISIERLKYHHLLDYHSYFSKENNKYLKRCSTSLAFRGNANKPQREHHFTPIRTAIIRKMNNNKGWQEGGEIRILVHCW